MENIVMHFDKIMFSALKNGKKEKLTKIRHFSVYSPLSPLQKTAIINHLEAIEALMMEHERLEEDEKRRNEAFVRIRLQRRPLLGQYEQLMKELHAEDQARRNVF